MERFVRGDVVVLPFPFSDLTGSKRRPALVLAELDGDDRILCQITGQQFRDSYSVPINDSDFREGYLRKISIIRPNRVFTADRKIIIYKAGHLKSDTINAALQKIIEILSG
ncbi:MAG: type II toxin-antitoxin system PemK/MazF family toxin [Methanothrix sp.]|uniref:type II toxin-antitoxin system PemK/MazF family toxin n=1 Tax=Methanothrix sp. TaxID=90426 RepID=UPI0025E52EE3|nr:type II toxin-antitoxin system PemK/MazF family toxin [Methanothrix sp.]MCK9406802.1 type II toxin-antitoxin system PemK/MazF family toxin [Methanothrix sp.]